MAETNEAMAKAWVYYNPKGVKREFNCEASESNPGEYTVTFQPGFTDNRYAAVATAMQGYAVISKNTPNTLVVRVLNHEGKAVASEFSLVIFNK